jgi:hypothetical protein
MTELAFPYRISGAGRTDDQQGDHIRDLIEQLLFTAPGERVNRPDFGTGLRELIFAPASDEMVAATQFLVQGALQQWLGEVIQVEAVDVVREESTLHVTIQYIVRRTQERRMAEFKQD